MTDLQKVSKKNLVLVRAGDKSLHPQWLSNDRNWDLIVSYYGDCPERYNDQYDFLHCFKGSKWQGIENFIESNLELINKYEYIWLPDDDLFCNAETINNFFEWCKNLNFTIAQPALTPYSFYSWPITVQVKECIARQTNFVEIMAPCFDVKSLRFFSKYFGENTSGWGYEWLWSEIAQKENIFNFGIIDQTPIFHTREVGGAGHGGAKSDPREEMRSLFIKFSLNQFEPTKLRQYS
ncbi:MAG: hypothetical protein ACI8PW_001046 [Methylophilaceae bacterium]|jgi:hypothetical protein